MAAQMFEVWCVNYRKKTDRPGLKKRVKVFDSERDAFAFFNFPPADVVVCDKPWSMIP